MSEVPQPPPPPAASRAPSFWFRIKPPFWALFFLGMGLTVHYLFPALRVPGWGYPGIAFLLAVFSAGLAVWAIAQFIHRQTAIIPGHPVTALVTDGPYRFSRNPMYLGLLTALASFAAGYGTLPLWIPPFALHFVLTRVFISWEESHLASLYPQDYPAYCAHVRRWL
jgi:protein-S-isoprenylcysteine O-methyltransferase Ste14